MSDPKFRPDLSVSNETIESMLRHHSVRAYSDKPVPEEMLQAVIAAAQSPSTWQNGNNWSLVVVKDPEIKRTLMKLTKRNAFMEDAPIFLVWCADMSRTAEATKWAGEDFVGVDYADTLLVPTVDAALAAQSAAIAAESLGLGICYIGGVRTSLAAVCDLLNLPHYCFPVTGMTLGWPSKDDTATEKPRMPQSGQIFVDRYDQDASLQAIEEMDANTCEYWRSQGMEEVSWSQRAGHSWHTLEHIARRDINTQVFHDRGYLLK